VRIWFVVSLLLLTAIPMTGYGQQASSTTPFNISDKSASSIISDGQGNIAVGYARVLPAGALTTPSGVAIFGYRPAGVLVTEAGVPASPLITNGRIYAEVGPNGSSGSGVDTGIAISNPNTQAASVNFYCTKSDGTNVACGLNGNAATLIGAGLQISGYLDQSPWFVPTNFQGTLTFTSNVPIAAVALQFNNNQRSESLFTTLPVINTSAPSSTTPAVLADFVDGLGFTTTVILVNPSNTPMSGAITFNEQDGKAVTLTANAQTAASFPYTVQGGASFKLQTAGIGNIQFGSVTVTPAAANNTPVALGVFSYANGTATVTQAGVPSLLGNAFRTYVEATPGIPTGTVGSYSTGVAIANTSSSAVTVTLNLFTAAGASTGLSTTRPLSAFGQTNGYLSDFFPTLQLPFQGVLEVTTPGTTISAVTLRIRINERGETLFTTTPLTVENSSPVSAELDFPQIVNAGGFTTQFILYSGTTGQATSGIVQFVKNDGTAFPLSVRSTISGPPVTLTSISPANPAVGQGVTLTGTNFASGQTVVFTTASGTIDVVPVIVSSTNMTATVPSNAITGPVFVRNGAQVSASFVIQIASTTGTSVPSTVTVNTSSTVTGADIYVSTPVAGLSFTGIGIGAPGSSISYYANTVIIARGAGQQLPAQQLLLVGSGLSSGTTVSVSGSGVTLSNVVFQSPAIFANIAVDPTAATGYRNVTLTNTNGDVSIMTGGLLIQ
jgi:hypothetical protein